jgi:cell wall-associated NlpC family hydrolase
MAEQSGMRARLIRLVVGAALLGGALVVIPASAALAFTDVPSSYWDYTAIQYVASTNTWMQDYGTQTFQPTIAEQRNYLAKTLVTIYAPNEQPDPSIIIADVPTTDPYWKYINVSIKLGWMPLQKGGKWKPTGVIRVAGFDKAIVLALGLKDDANGLLGIHMLDGTTYTVNEDFAYVNLAKVLELHFNHPTSAEQLDIDANTHITRDEVAYSIWWAKTQMTWQTSHAAWYKTVALATLDPTNATQAQKISVTEYAIGAITDGWPYIYAGEWNAASPPGYCCGSQPRGGMDCSGFVWWVEKKYESGYNAAQFHPDYAGWSILDRTSSDMAHSTTTQVTFNNLRVGDLMFFTSDGGGTWQDVTHVAMYLGNNWMVHSTDDNDGVLLESVAPGTYYNDTFLYGRHVIGVSDAPAHHVTKQSLLGGDH